MPGSRPTRARRDPRGAADGRAGGALLRVRVQPRAARDEVAGWQAGAVRVRVTAPPVEGAANRAMVGVLARALGVKPGAVSLVRGERGRDKLVRVDGVSQPEIEARLGRPRG